MVCCFVEVALFVAFSRFSMMSGGIFVMFGSFQVVLSTRFHKTSLVWCEARENLNALVKHFEVSIYFVKRAMQPGRHGSAVSSLVRPRFWMPVVLHGDQAGDLLRNPNKGSPAVVVRRTAINGLTSW